MKYTLAIVAVLLSASPILAQHKHSDKGPNGGQMQDVAGVDAELITSGNIITINVFDEGGKPVPTKGYTASVLVAGGGEREIVKLDPSENNALKGNAKKPLAPTATVTLTIKTSEGKSGQVSFKSTK